MRVEGLGRFSRSFTIASIFVGFVASSNAQTPATLTDAQIEYRADRALEQEPQLAHERISTYAEQSSIIIVGAVSSVAQCDVAEQTVARGASGMTIVNHLVVRHSDAIGGSQSELQCAQVRASDGVGEPAIAPSLVRRPVNAQQMSPRTESTGQMGGLQVTIPPGRIVNIHINGWLASSQVKPGDAFSGIVTRDVVAEGAVAIPRGADVEGQILYSEDGGRLSGRGYMSLILTSISLGGRDFPLYTKHLAITGPQRGFRTGANTIVLAALGAIAGGAAGHGTGAAIGAGIGGAAGLGLSAASSGEQAVINEDSVLGFELIQEATVVTVSQDEMGRLSSAVDVPAQQVSTPAYVHPEYFYPPYAYDDGYWGPAVFVGSDYGRSYHKWH